MKVEDINAMNETESKIENLKKVSRPISVDEIETLLKNEQFHLYGVRKKENVISRGRQYRIYDENCIREETRSGYYTIALRTLKK
ncbi:hypothetical protein Barb6_03705 [Bacteroidales bacterium Barb6]|nr:hypothetical protein Barb6_03705 [Bacteroidales bacterium Barb6]OAV76057.1 hypothetical protein Barb7_00291 [Bacteroidales bacterium Barb7]